MQSLSHYSLIGNCRSAALVSKYGSIDWCCLPEFHSPALFARLLDKNRGGQFSISPLGQYKSSQQNLTDTNILETIFITETAQVKLTDAFIATTEEIKSCSLFPDHEILRVVTCTAGTAKMQMDYSPAVFYGKSPANLQHNGKMGIRFSYRENVFILLSTLEPDKIVIVNGKAVSSFEINEGESILFSMSSSSQEPAVLPEIHITARIRLDQTIDYWKDWTKRCSYNGIYQGCVRRSALALKLLAHAPSGAIIAAPTTSLPEETGGERNWDYRFCWLRDASFTVRVLLKLGFEEETHAYMNWILHATQLTRPKLQVVYSVFGESHLRESELEWLDGYESSKPIRIGNGAYGQHQLDVYGEVLDAFYAYSRIIGQFDNGSRKFMLGLGDVICKTWDKPDNGIWERRSGKAHHTHSKVLAWVGMDRLIRIIKKYKWQNADLTRYEKIKDAIAQKIERFGYNGDIGSYTAELGGTTLDASALVYPLVGYSDVSSPRMASTVNVIARRLSGNDLIYRYLDMDDGVTGKEGCFGICNFWLVECLARSGKLNDAVQLFDALLKYASPTGLLAEEIDPFTHEMLGNYPQGFTHIGLINAALSINERFEKGGLVA